MTASAHVLVFRPLIRLLRERGDDLALLVDVYHEFQKPEPMLAPCGRST